MAVLVGLRVSCRFRHNLVFAGRVVATWSFGSPMTGVLIADEQGLGKTCQALAVCEAAALFPIIVVVPSSVRLNWRREIAKWLPHRSTEIVYGTNVERFAPSADVLIFGWETIYAWADIIDVPKALILDELHLAKSGQARRTKAVLRLADRVHDSDGVVIGLTGTPVLSRVGELVPQLRILNRLADFGGAAKFKTDYAKRLPLLNRALRAKCYVRRRKIDVLKDLPAKRYTTVVLETTDLEMGVYKAAERDIVAYLAEVARNAALQAGASSEEARRAAVVKALRAQAAQQLVAITALRQLAVKAKLAAVDEWMSDFVATDEKVVVFCWHREIVELLANRYSNGLKLYGGMDDADKQFAVDKFQTDPDQQVLVCGMKAAGVGITLTASSNVVFVEQGWTPADVDQAADRCHRIGQTDSVTVFSLNAAETIDDYMTDLIASKRLVVDAATDGVAQTDDDMHSVLADLMVRMFDGADASTISE